MSLWDQVKLNMTEWYAVAADKTGEMARVGVRKYDQFALSRQIERSFQELGSRVYELLGAGRADVAADGRTRELCVRIRGLEEQLAAKEQEIQVIRETAKSKSRASAGVAGGVPVPASAEGGPEAVPEAARQGEIEEAAAGLSLDEGEIEASIDPTPRASDLADEAWDEEMAVWHQPLDLGEDAADEPDRPSPERD